MSTEIAYIALGANLGDPVGMLTQTVLALSELAQTPSPDGGPVFAVSALYRSAPFQASGPDYYNAAVRLCTDLSPNALLDRLQALENAGGRVRSTVNAPRTLDLDLLLQDKHQINTLHLTLPHPRMHERAFVLRPLLDLGAGDVRIPLRGRIADLEVSTRDQQIEKLPEPWVKWAPD